jgi:DNA replication protein DnaC
MKSEAESAGGIAETLLERFREKGLPVPGENEYIGENGLLFCSVCHTPKQCRVSVMGRTAVMRCICDCDKKRLEREKKRQEEEELQRRIRRLKANGIQEKHLLDWRFDVAEDTADIRKARKYVENWQRVKAENLGLLLWGYVGTGKSFMAACIANALLEQGVPVLMTNFSKILNQMGAMYSEERYQYIASFSNFPLLIIDDLGIERNTEYALEQVYAVIDERYKSGLPLIITTNLTMDELNDPADVAHGRIYSRVLEMCTPIQVLGSDRRKDIGRQKKSAVKEVLEL